MLAVAPRGRLSWIPNILGAPEVPPAPLHHQEDKTAAGRTNRRKVLEEEEEMEEKEGVYGMTEDSTIWFVFSGIKISESGRTHKREREGEEERGRRGGGTNRKKRESRKKKCAGGSDTSVLLSCTTFNRFLFNST